MRYWGFALTPERIDRYEIIRKIATGGMAELFLAKQLGMEGFEKAVVIKSILSHLAQDQEFVSMFLDEARIAAKLSHPNIAQIYDLGRANDSYYIAMEYVSGRNMAAVVRKARDVGMPLPIEHTCKIVASVCDGLYYAHTRKDFDGKPLNIIHRDISPQNILVSFTGTVKLVDFGIAKASTQIAQTRAGVLKGKYAYMSPEQVRGDKIDARSDIFAVGIVMYELLTGQRPFERESSLKTLKAIVQEKPLNPRELNPDVPIEVVRILSRALEKNPDRRFANGQDMQLALEDYLDRSPRKSNTVRLSRYLYEVFDDELNADGGTMIVKGIGEIIMPTGASSDAASDPQIDELPEGTVRAALQEIEASREPHQRDAVSIVTDEKDHAEVDEEALAATRSGSSPATASPVDEPPADDDDFGEEEFPDTVMQPLPERPPERNEDFEDEDSDAQTASGVELSRDPAPTLDLSGQEFANSGVATNEDGLDDDRAQVDEDDEEEIDGATIPAYDLEQYMQDRARAAGESDLPEDDEDPTSASSRVRDELTDDASIPEPEEGETASLSPDQVRRILDRVESLRQQASGGDSLAESAELAEPAETPPATPEISLASDAVLPSASDHEIAVDEVDYSSDLGAATRAQPAPDSPDAGGNGSGWSLGGQDGALPGLSPAQPTMDLPAFDPADADDTPLPGPPLSSAGPPLASQDPPQGSGGGGIRITRRRASQAELNERAAIASSSGMAPPIRGDAPRAYSAEGSSPALAPLATHMAGDLGGEASRTRPVSAPLPMPSPTTTDPDLDAEAYPVSNAKLMLILAILVAVAAGLGLVYVLVFHAPSSNAGVATVVDGMVVLKTIPPGAQVVLDTREHQQRTPAMVGGLSVDHSHSVVFKLEGYKDEERQFVLTPEQRMLTIEVTMQKLRQAKPKGRGKSAEKKKRKKSRK